MASLYNRHRQSNSSSALKKPYDIYGGQFPESSSIDENYDNLLCDDITATSKKNKNNFEFVDEYSHREFEDNSRLLTPDEFFAKRRSHFPQNNAFANQNRPLTPEEFRQTIDYRGKNKEEQKNNEYQKKYRKKNEIAKPRKRKLKAGISLFILCIFTLAGYYIFNDVIFTAKYINIDGISKYTNKEILTLAGIKQNQSLSTIDPKELKKKINKKGDLQLVKFNFVYPNGIYMKVLEKIPVAVVSSNGYYYFLDKDANVIERTDNLENSDNLIRVTNCNMIQNIGENKSEIRQQWQKDAYIKIFNAMHDLKISDKFSSLSLSKENEMYLYTSDGFVINLGDSEDIVSKLAVSNSMRDYVLQQGRTEGRIDVSLPQKPVFANEDNKVLYDPKYQLDMSPLEYERLQQQQNANP